MPLAVGARALGEPFKADGAPIFRLLKCRFPSIHLKSDQFVLLCELPPVLRLEDFLDELELPKDDESDPLSLLLSSADNESELGDLGCPFPLLDDFLTLFSFFRSFLCCLLSLCFRFF